jgi:hypothetical protein
VNFSLGLVAALALVAPGIVMLLALVRRPGGGEVAPAQPQPSSVLAFGVIVVASLGAHATLAGLLTLLDAPAALDPYRSLLQAPAHPERLGRRDLFAVLAAFLLLAGAAWPLGLWLGAIPAARRALFGWLAELVERLERDRRDANTPAHPLRGLVRLARNRPAEASEPTARRMFAAFVLTTTAHDGVVLGYRGLVRSIALDADREIASLVLDEVNRFTLKLHEGGLTTSQHGDAERIPSVYLPRASIANAVITVLEVPPADPPPARRPRRPKARPPGAPSPPSP